MGKIYIDNILQSKSSDIAQEIKEFVSLHREEIYKVKFDGFVKRYVSDCVAMGLEPMLNETIGIARPLWNADNTEIDGFTWEGEAKDDIGIAYVRAESYVFC